LRIRRAIYLFSVIVSMACGSTRAQISSSPGTGRGLPETIEAIGQRAREHSILYITAHPDDESGAVLTYLRADCTQMWRCFIDAGRSGQNALGPEQGRNSTDSNAGIACSDARLWSETLFHEREGFWFLKTPVETEKIWVIQVS